MNAPRFHIRSLIVTIAMLGLLFAVGLLSVQNTRLRRVASTQRVELDRLRDQARLAEYRVAVARLTAAHAAVVREAEVDRAKNAALPAK
jgi:hypothetical protein